MQSSIRNPRVLIVTPEVTYLPKGMGNMANMLAAKAGGLADVSAALINALFEQGGDVYVAIPDYRAMFGCRCPALFTQQLEVIRNTMPEHRVHLARDRIFFYQNRVYSFDRGENMKMALAFQREVINNILPQVKPDLIHCNDWMTGLIPAVARQMGIPSLFTVHNIHTEECTMNDIEDRGIDAAYFWEKLYFKHMPDHYEESREHNPVDFMATGIFASHFVNTVSSTFLREIIEGYHDFVPPAIRSELINKWKAGCSIGILNSPDPSFLPESDTALFRNFDAENHVEGKRENKRLLQEKLGLLQNDRAPVFFWPSRLDPVQKGCQLLAEILFKVVERFREQQLQVVFVANGEFQKHFKNIVALHDIPDRVAVCDFDEDLARKAYAASDFVLMPSLFEPCGLPQMIGPIYGVLPVAHDTGGIHDTVQDLDIEHDCGNGFLFKYYDIHGLNWAIDQAMQFHALPEDIRAKQIQRIMIESKSVFNHEVTARQYIDLYEKMLNLELVQQ
jgi:starch synthase/alpha-amylase